MLVAVNPVPNSSEFKKLMEMTTSALNQDALKRHSYYASRGGDLLEDDVCKILAQCAAGTPFSGTIKKISGHCFPDIIAANYYGVEVKSSIKNRWTSIGNSISEGLRIGGVERIYMTFGKLGGNPIEFLSRPYEECLCEIAVTHKPRYKIDMCLDPGKSIFDKMGISYDEFRKKDDPIAVASVYYRGLLKPGEDLWWAADDVDETVPAIIRLWTHLSPDEKKEFTLRGCVKFPEVFGGNYDRYVVWAASQGVVNSHVRDQFSSGGRVSMFLSDGTTHKFPAVYGRVKSNKDLFVKYLAEEEPTVTSPLELKKKIISWCGTVSELSHIDRCISLDALSVLFFNKAFSEIRDEIS